MKLTPCVLEPVDRLGHRLLGQGSLGPLVVGDDQEDVRRLVVRRGLFVVRPAAPVHDGCHVTAVSKAAVGRVCGTEVLLGAVLVARVADRKRWTPDLVSRWRRARPQAAVRVRRRVDAGLGDEVARWAGHLGVADVLTCCGARDDVAGDEVCVGEPRAVDAEEHHPVTVPVDDVAIDEGGVGVRREPHAVVAVVIDQIRLHIRVQRAAQVDRIGGAIVDPVPEDPDPLRPHHEVGARLDHPYPHAGCLAGDVVVADHQVVAFQTSGGPSRRSLEHELFHGDAVRGVLDRDTAANLRHLAGIAHERDPVGLVTPGRVLVLNHDVL